MTEAGVDFRTNPSPHLPHEKNFTNRSIPPHRPPGIRTPSPADSRRQDGAVHLLGRASQAVQGTHSGAAGRVLRSPSPFTISTRHPLPWNRARYVPAPQPFGGTRKPAVGIGQANRQATRQLAHWCGFEVVPCPRQRARVGPKVSPGEHRRGTFRALTARERRAPHGVRAKDYRLTPLPWRRWTRRARSHPQCRCGKCGSAESQHPRGFAAGRQCGTQLGKCGKPGASLCAQRRQRPGVRRRAA